MLGENRAFQGTFWCACMQIHLKASETIVPCVGNFAPPLLGESLQQLGLVGYSHRHLDAHTLSSTDGIGSLSCFYRTISSKDLRKNLPLWQFVVFLVVSGLNYPLIWLLHDSVASLAPHPT